MMTEELLEFNGVDALRGGYLFPSLSRREILGVGTAGGPGALAEASQVWQSRQDHLGMVYGFRYEELSEAGWGLVFANTEDPGVYGALEPLRKLRQEQAGERYREYRGDKGYQPGDTKTGFLRRNLAPVSGPADPRKMPYYLLIVGSPEAIPYEFQYNLDVQYGVGRIHFDRVEEYAQYAAAVDAAERGRVRRDKRMTFFGVAKEGDRATLSSSKLLVEPLRKVIGESHGETWKLDSVIGEKATKKRLTAVLGGEETPALLFTASHGMGFSQIDPRQRSEQGALLCQDWPGAGAEGSNRPYYFAAEDLASDASVAGTVAMMFACYGGGTPKWNEFEALDRAVARSRKLEIEPARQIAAESFVAALPQRMLSHPKGGALAVIAHVERAISFSYQNRGDSESSYIGTFESAIRKLLDGFPVGFAMEEFNGKHAELGNELKDSMAQLRMMTNPPVSMVNLVTDYYDTRNYSVIGDPAVRLATGRG